MRSFPFDSDVTYDELGNPEYDRGADSTILANFIHLMFADGVFPNPSTGLQVTASSETMSVIVLPGNCMIQGRMGIEENNRTLVFEASGTSYDRIDSVVARLNTNHDYRDIDLYVIKGKESSSPVVPELTRTGGIYELRLANVFIAKNTTIISPERITDTRLNTEDCGIVTSNPNPVDTTTIFKQYQAALDKYLQYVEECIDGTTAGNLQKEIDEIRNSIGVADISSIGDGTLTGGLKSLNKDLANTNSAVSELNTNLDTLSDNLNATWISPTLYDTTKLAANGGITINKIGKLAILHANIGTKSVIKKNGAILNLPNGYCGGFNNIPATIVRSDGTVSAVGLYTSSTDNYSHVYVNAEIASGYGLIIDIPYIII